MYRGVRRGMFMTACACLVIAVTIIAVHPTLGLAAIVVVVCLLDALYSWVVTRIMRRKIQARVVVAPRGRPKAGV